MKIIALYKVWSGHELLQASVESIYNHVDKIVILTSNVSWIGGKDNPSIPVIETLIGKKYPGNKIIHINYDEPNQVKHCMYAYRYIQNNFDCDYIMLIDSDELWDTNSLKYAKQYIQQGPQCKAYRTSIFTYIKSPFYRIEPPEPLKPVCFIKPDLPDMGLEPRGCAIKPYKIINEVYYHHFVFVREHFNNVLEKLIQSHVSEKQPYENMADWIPNVWNKMPLCRRNFHPAIGFGTHWKSIKQVKLEDLPEVLHHNRFPNILKWGK